MPPPLPPDVPPNVRELVELTLSKEPGLRYCSGGRFAAWIWTTPITVISLIQSLKSAGKGIIFISHNLRDIFEVADRIVVFRRGENAGERNPGETSADEIVRLMVGK